MSDPDPSSSVGPEIPESRDEEAMRSALRKMRVEGTRLDDAAAECGVDPDELYRWTRHHFRKQIENPEGAEVIEQGVLKRIIDHVEPPERSQEPADAGDAPEGEADPEGDEADGERWRPEGLPKFVPFPEPEEVDPWEEQLAFDKEPEIDPDWKPAGSAAVLLFFFGSKLRIGLVALVAFIGIIATMIFVSRAYREAPEAISAKSTPRLPNKNDRNEAGKFAIEFLKAEGLEKKLEFVLEPDRIRPLAEEWYRRPGNERYLNAPAQAEVAESLGALLDGRPFTMVETMTSEGKQIFPVQIVDDGSLRIDWEAAVAYEPIPWEAFRANRVTKATPFRVRCERSDYFNFPFADDKAFDSFRIGHPRDNNAPPLYGYAEKGSGISTLLFHLSENPKGFCAPILSLRFPEEGAPECVEIVSVVSGRWVAKPEAPPAGAE